MKILVGLALIVVAVVLFVQYQSAWGFVAFIIGGYLLSGRKGKKSLYSDSGSWGDGGSDGGGGSGGGD